MSDGFLLFCFPLAGGTIEFYNDIEKVCGENVKFIKLEYSGHGSRMKEPLYSTFDEMTDDLYPQILSNLKKYPNADYSLMGYSMGSIAAFNVLQKIEKENEDRKPWRVFLSAHQPQPINSLRNLPKSEVDEWVKLRTVEFGGVDQKLINNNIFWRVYLPIFKSDYLMIANYDFDNIEFFTKVPATIFYSEIDTPYNEMCEWKKYFIGECDFVRYEGSHFFIENYYKDMANVICKTYQTYKRGGSI